MFPCRHCAKSYQSQSSLARHLRNHSIDHSRHVCPTCDVVFSRRDLLRRHMSIHRGLLMRATLVIVSNKSRNTEGERLTVYASPIFHA